MGAEVVCLLPVRNGERDLQDYLRAAEGFCDAIVALDDGSTDETRSILEASALVQVLLANPPRESFRGWDDGANRSRLLAASAELEPQWILSIDADERMDDEDAQVLRSFIRTDALPGCAYGFQSFRMWGRDAYDPTYWWVYRLFAYEPGQSFPDRRLHFSPIPTSIPRSQWLRTTIRTRHLATATEERRLAWLEKCSEADPGGPTHWGGLGERPSGELPRWQPRPSGIPVLLDVPPSGDGRPWLRLPRRKAAEVKRDLLRRLRAGADAHMFGAAPLLPDFSDLEPLFADSERKVESLLRPFRREFRWPLRRVYNLWFESVDAELYYSMVRRNRPALIVEVGSGHSTGFATEAIRKNGSGRIVSIDPNPRIDLPEEVEHIESRVEDVDPSLFRGLGEGDILFIDSSHTTEEARYHVERILPILQKGVICHHHDVCFPWADYMGGDQERFGEPDVLLDFYGNNRDTYRIEMSASYVRYRNPELLTKLVPSYRLYPERIPASLWTRKVA